MHVLTGEYRPPPSATSGPGTSTRRQRRFVEADALIYLGREQQLTGDYPAAAGGLQQALELHRDLGNLNGRPHALSSLGVVNQETGDYPAAASQQQALALFGDLGRRLSHADALNRLGGLSSRTSASG